MVYFFVAVVAAVVVFLFFFGSWTGDFNACNLCDPSAFPGMTRRERAAQFSRVVFYRPPPPPTDGARGPPTPTRMRGIPLVRRGKGSGGDGEGEGGLLLFDGEGHGVSSVGGGWYDSIF